MPPQQYQRRPFKATVRGMTTAVPINNIPDTMLAYAQNVRIYSGGEIRPRPGQGTAINSAFNSGAAIHSIFRLNDNLPTTPQAFARIIGAGTKVGTDNNAHTAFTAIQESAVDLVFSGNPLTFATSRPFQSPDPYVYIGDSLRSRKVRSDGMNWNWGGAPPIKPLTVAQGSPIFKVIDDFESAASWTAAGTAGALTATARLAAMAIDALLYDDIALHSGWCSVVPHTFSQDIQPGMLFQPSVAETVDVRVDDIFDKVTSTTIGSIQYDSGSSGLCTIQPTIAVPGLRRNMLLNLKATEDVRVVSVTEGPDGITSFRCSTVGTFAATDAIAGYKSFRCFFVNAAAHTTAETLSCKYVSSLIAGSGTGTITRTVALDLSNISNRPIQPDDEIHLGVWTDTPLNLVAGRIIFNIDATDTTFTFNTLFREFRPDDLSPAIAGSQTIITTQRTVLTRQILENIRKVQDVIRSSREDSTRFGLPFDPELAIDPSLLVGDGVSTQTTPGASQWTELVFKVSDLQRVGSDNSRTLANVTQVRIQFQTTADTNIRIDDLWIGGTYGPHSPIDDLSLLPYYYAHRYRSSSTGTKTLFSPPVRSGEMPQRNSIKLTPVANSYVDPQFDKIDFIRFGGNINNWSLIGTGDVGSAFIDTLPDSTVVGLPTVNLNEDFQPFPTIDTPRTGTCNVKGTSVIWASGDHFNASWSRNTDIFINGVRYTLFTNPSDTTHLELNENAGTQTTVNFYIPQATILGQPLPAVWGAVGGGLFGDVIFATGDLHQPGVLFWTNPGEPDSTRDVNNLEITSGSEELMNGVIYRGRCYVYSNLRPFEVVPRFGYGYSILDQLGSIFIAQPITEAHGLFARYAICAGDMIYYLSQDGIYMSDGGQEKRISDDLYNLFQHDGLPGETVTLNNGIVIVPPDFTQKTKMFFTYYDSFVYFDYQGTDGNPYTLVYNTLLQAWTLDIYPAASAIKRHYGEPGQGVHSLVLGGTNGILYQSTVNALDVATAVAARIRYGSFNMDDDRTRKLFAEIWLDIDTLATNATLTTGLDEFGTALTPVVVNVNGRTKKVFQDIASGAGTLNRNIAIDLQFSSGAFWGWESSYLLRPEDIFLRFTAFDNDGEIGNKFVQGILIEANTFNQSVTVDVYSDDGTLIDTLVLKHNGQSTIPYSFDVPYRTHMMRLQPKSNTNNLELFSWKWKWNAEPEKATTWQTQATSHNFKGFHHIRDMFLPHLSTADWQLTINVDSIPYGPYTVPSSGGKQAKFHLMFPAVKGKLFDYHGESTDDTKGFEVFQQDIEIRAKEWGSEAAYQSLKPWGGPSYSEGATI